MGEVLFRVAIVLSVNLVFTFLNFCLLIGIRYKTYEIEKALNERKGDKE